MILYRLLGNIRKNGYFGIAHSLFTAHFKNVPLRGGQFLFSYRQLVDKVIVIYFFYGSVIQKMFEEEYARLINDEFHIWDEDYNEYLRRFTPLEVHRGYFSIDKKTNRVIDGKVEKKTGLSDDISAYDLILKNKERLLFF